MHTQVKIQIVQKLKKNNMASPLCVRLFKSHKNEIELREKKIRRKVQPTHKPHTHAAVGAVTQAHIACLYIAQ